MGWVNRMAQELLAAPHLHLTLTIAKEMRPDFDRQSYRRRSPGS
jgi:hypothetical protein